MRVFCIRQIWTLTRDEEKCEDMYSSESDIESETVTESDSD